MTPNQTTTEKPQQTNNPISIEKYILELEGRRQKIISENESTRPPIPLTYDQFCQLISAHGSNYLATRGENALFQIDNQNEPIIRQLYFYFTRNSQFRGFLSKGMLINGKYGSGKTVLMHALVRTYNDCVSHWKEKGITIYPMRIIKSSDIVDAFRFESNKNNTKDVPGYGDNLKINVLKKTYLQGIIIIDELGREQKEVNIWGTVIQPLSQILQERYDQGFPTFATANFHIETLSKEEYYGQMVGDRLRQMFNEITLNGESRRK